VGLGVFPDHEPTANPTADSSCCPLEKAAALQNKAAPPAGWARSGKKVHLCGFRTGRWWYTDAGRKAKNEILEENMSPSAAPNTELIYDIPIREITLSDENVRQTDREKELDELADSIAKYGQLQPVLLRGSHGNPPYELIVGQRRFLACKRLNKPNIRCVFAGPLTNVQASIRSLAENMLRVELNHADAARAITHLYKYFGRDERRVQKETGISLRRIRQYIDVEERATPVMKRELNAKKVTPADVQRALRAAGGDSNKAERLLDRMRKYQLTTYQKKTLVEFAEGNPGASVGDIVAEAQKPRHERTIMVNLPDDVHKGLERAAKKLAMGPEEVAAQALSEWLSAKGFIHAG
jgi:ParB/RepB/Spo0J family partition protein